MRTAHHPTDLKLLEYAAATVDAGQALVLRAHLELCPSCRLTVAALEEVGGSMLTELQPTPMATASSEQARALAGFSWAKSQVRPPSPLNDMVELPNTARHYRLGGWHWSGPGVQWRSLELPVESVSRVFLLRARHGTRLPQHTHSDTELTLVLKGSFSHDGGRFARGDLDDADSTVEHQPVVDSESECICLVAMQGSLMLSGLIGRILQPLVRF